MGLIQSLFKVGRKKIGDIEEAYDDKTIIEQLTQDIRDGKKRLAEADESRIDLRANRARMEREMREFEDESAKYLDYAKKAKEAGEMETAKQCLAKHNNLKTKFEAAKSNFDMLDESIKTLDAEINSEKSTLEQIEGELSSIEANKKMLDAQESISSKLGQGRNASGSAAGSLARAKEVNAKRRDKLQARKDINSDDDLEAKALALGESVDLDDQLSNL